MTVDIFPKRIETIPDRNIQGMCWCAICMTARMGGFPVEGDLFNEIHMSARREGFFLGPIPHDRFFHGNLPS